MENAGFYSGERFIYRYGLPFRVLFYRQEKTFRHYHDFEELVLILEGRAVHEIEGKTRSVSPGDVFLIRQGRVHSYRNPKHCLLVNLLFDKQEIDRCLFDLRDMPGYRNFFEAENPPVLSLEGDELRELRMLAAKLDREIAMTPPGHRFMADLYFREIIGKIARNASPQGKKDSVRMLILSKMTDFIGTHFSENVSRDDIVRAGGVSVSTASRIFRELLNENMMDYLQKIRLRHAELLLNTTDDSIGNIAFRCGFRDSNYFSVCFRRANGISPRRSRKQT